MKRVWGAFMRVHPALRFSGPAEAFVRSLGETLPAALPAAAFLIARGFVGNDGAGAGPGRDFVRPGFVAALGVLRFIAAALLILFWPGGSTPRYYLADGAAARACSAASATICSASGGRKSSRPIMLLTAALLAYALVYAARRAVSAAALPASDARCRADRRPACKPRPGRSTGPATPGSTSCPTCPARSSRRRPMNWPAVTGPAWMLLPNDEAAACCSRGDPTSCTWSCRSAMWNNGGCCGWIADPRPVIASVSEAIQAGKAASPQKAGIASSLCSSQ